MSSPGEIAKKINSGYANGVTELTALRTAGKDDDIIRVVRSLQPPGIFSSKPLWVELSMVLQYSKPMTKLAVVEMMDSHIPRGSQVTPDKEHIYEPTLVAFGPLFNIMDDYTHVDDGEDFLYTLLGFAMNHCSNVFFARPMVPGARTFVAHLRRAMKEDDALYRKMVPVLSNMVAGEDVAPTFRELNVEDTVTPLLADREAINRVFGMAATDVCRVFSTHY